jgi:acetolactate synthase-1/2/3 large subunit
MSAEESSGLPSRDGVYWNMNAAELLIKSLEQEGVEYVFAVPGEENLDVLEAIRKSKLKLVVTRHEQAAGFMAATVGRLAGKVGVCLSTLGPGATNLVTAAAFAQLGGMPMLMLTGQKPIKKSKQGSFQIINTVEMFKPITKYSKRITHGNDIAVSVRQAIKTAEDERPGAVHIELPEDIAAESVEVEPLEIQQVRRPIAEYKAIKRAVEMIAAAKSPLLLVGAGANRKLTSKMLTEFVDKFGIYFFNTQMGKGVIDERSPYYLGTAALSSGDYLHCAIERADLIINVGHDVIEKPPFIMKRDGIKVIHINFNPAQLDAIYFPQLEVVGDIANAIWQIKEQLEVQQGWDFSYYERTRAAIQTHIAENSSSEGFPVLPQRLVAELRRQLPDNGILSLDNGMYKLWFSRHYPAYAPNTLLLDNALATMGAGLPNAIAAKLLRPEQPVVAVVGDGGFMMNSQELETAARLGLDLGIVLLNDNGYGMIKWKQQAAGLENFGLEYNNPDFVKYAESYGIVADRVTSAAELPEKLQAVTSGKGVRLLEVAIDYSQNHKVLTEELAQRTCNF